MESSEANVIIRDLCETWSCDVGTQLEYLIRMLVDETYWRVHGEMLSLTLTEELRIEEWTRIQLLDIREQLREEEV